MRLIITRPEEDALPLKAKLETLGHTAILAPLLKIVPRPHAYVPPLAYQLICITSANALKFLQVEDRLKTIPLLAVGPQSLSTAQENGFRFAESHGGDVQGLAAHAAAKFDPQKGPVLYLSGAETSADLQALLMASGFAVERVITYKAVVQTPPEIHQILAEANGVLIYSPRTRASLVQANDKFRAGKKSGGIHILLPVGKRGKSPPRTMEKACRKNA